MAEFTPMFASSRSENLEKRKLLDKKILEKRKFLCYFFLEKRNFATLIRKQDHLNLTIQWLKLWDTL